MHSHPIHRVVPGPPVSTAGRRVGLGPESMRAAGFSRAKIAALQDLAAKAIDGTLPTAAVIRRLDDDAIVDRLVAVRGIGRWTVEMLLIFQLGRPDVLPVDDFGVRNGFRIAYKRPMPTLKNCYDMENGGGRIGLPPPGICGARSIRQSPASRDGAVETFDQASLQWPIRISD